MPGENGQVATSAQAASGGRHPLPSRERFAVWLSSIGFANDMQAVVYDRNGCNYCGRLWWMLRWAGHDAVAVLDGGLQAWQAGGQAVNSGEEPCRFQANFELGQPLETLKTVAQVESDLGQPSQTLIDARAPPVIAARSSLWTRWPVISPVRSTARSAAISLPTAAQACGLAQGRI